jgi:hypothetical protein
VFLLLTYIREYPRICTGTRLKCMSKILHRIGNYNYVSYAYSVALMVIIDFLCVET